MNSFETNQLVIGVKPTDRPDSRGVHNALVLITSIRRRHAFRDGTTGLAYVVTQGQVNYAAKPEWLRPNVPWGWAGIPPTSTQKAP